MTMITDIAITHDASHENPCQSLWTSSIPHMDTRSISSTSSDDSSSQSSRSHGDELYRMSDLDSISFTSYRDTREAAIHEWNIIMRDLVMMWQSIGRYDRISKIHDHQLDLMGLSRIQPQSESQSSI